MERRKVRELVSFVRGVSYKKDQAEKEAKPGYTVILRANNINNGRFQYDELVYVPSTLIKNEQIINKDDIVITMSSGSKAHVGKVAIAKEETSMSFGAFCAKIIPERIYPQYLFYAFMDGAFRRHIEAASKGTNINNLKQEYILDYEVQLPSIEEQKHIVAYIEELFSQLDSGVETLKKTKQQLEVYRKAVITAAFHLEQETEWKRLDKISDISGGITKGRDLSGQETLSLPYLRVANVQDGYLDLSEMKTIELKSSERGKYLLKKGDVLYTEGGDRDKLGRGTVWHGEIENCVHQNHIFKARINCDIAKPEYVAYWSMSVPARNYFYDKGKQSVNLASINKTVLSSLELPLPSLYQQAKTVQEIEAALSVCGSIEETIEKALQQAAAMRQRILQQSFGGR